MVSTLVVLTYLLVPYLLHSAAYPCFTGVRSRVIVFQIAFVYVWKNLYTRWPSSLDCYKEAKAWKGGYEGWAPSMQQCLPNNLLEARVAGVIMEILICETTGPALSEMETT